MILESRKRWWHVLFPPEDPNRGSTSWVERKKCTRTLTTPSNEHRCEIVGPHYSHVCADANCKFRWAA